MKSKIILITFMILLTFSCKKYESYTSDFSYTSVYFGSQKPLRTIIARDTMQFKFGVSIGGVIENKQDLWVTYRVDPNMLTGTGFTLLPDTCYTVSDASHINIKSGNLTGDVTLTLNRAKFLALPNAHLKTYALPLRLTGKSEQIDSFTIGKDTTIIVVKYQNVFQGNYYHRGVQTFHTVLTTGGDSVANIGMKDLNQSPVWKVSTIGNFADTTSAIGSESVGSIQIVVNSDNTVSLTKTPKGSFAVSNASGFYNPQLTQFYLKYDYKQPSKNKYNTSVIDTLFLRQRPELDLRFEEW